MCDALSREHLARVLSEWRAAAIRGGAAREPRAASAREAEGGQMSAEWARERSRLHSAAVLRVLRAERDRFQQAMLHAWRCAASSSRQQASLRKQLDAAAAESSAKLRRQGRIQGLARIGASREHLQHVTLRAWAEAAAVE
eukprot:CAMPEP_0195134304 /NCGR_PEP_ID=MMETSP0448-20130528/150375_1 /TAXON_ID=66468 /ORGANISM="Heterocapsa triquestra, Strain CCMP 448" /LENGTH=140 /DNA_ID=CAMNT_0040172395 /DNA_START=19 /DNA_END=438 /DNA_ORIENTATION=+